MDMFTFLDKIIVYATSLGASIFTVIAIVGTLTTKDLHQMKDEIKIYLNNASDKFTEIETSENVGDQQFEVGVFYNKYKSLTEYYNEQKDKMRTVDHYIESFFALAYSIFAVSLFLIILSTFCYHFSFDELLNRISFACIFFVYIAVASLCYYNGFKKFVSLFFHKDNDAEIPSLDNLFSPNNLLDIKDTHVRLDLPLKLFAISNWFTVLEDGDGGKLIKMFSNGLFKYSAKFLCETSAGDAFEGNFNSNEFIYEDSIEQYVGRFCPLPQEAHITRVEISFKTVVKTGKMTRSAVYIPSAKNKTKLCFTYISGVSSNIGLVCTPKLILLRKSE